MFCSNCGKTLKGDAATCPHCGNAIGDSRFDGHNYTGAQVRTKPGEAVRLPANHTKTTFMGSDSSMDADVDARTTYRATAGARVPEYAQAEEREPLYDSQKADEYREDMQAQENDLPAEEAPIPRRKRRAEMARNAENEAQSLSFADEKPVREAKKRPVKAKKPPKPEQADKKELEEEQAELEEIRARDIQLDTRVGISDDVRSYMNRLREEALQKQLKQQKKQEQKTEQKQETQASKPEKKKLDFRSLRNRFRRPEEDFDAIVPDEAEEADEFDLSDLPPMTESDQADDEVDAVYGTEDEFEEAPEAEFDEAEEFEGETEEFESDDEEYGFEDELAYNRRKKTLTIVKYSVAALIVVAVLAGAIIGLSFLTEKTKTAPIDGVTLSLYTEGVELMQYRVSNQYQNEKLKEFNGSVSSMVGVNDSITKDLDALSSMLPEAPSVNDNRFIAALSAIQTNINNCLTNDMMALTDTGKTAEEREAASKERWDIVREMVNMLANATNPAQLDGIVNGEKIDVIQNTTPEPVLTTTPPPYTTLAVGSDGQQVTELQSRLSALGYLKSEVDGDFGSKTKTAVQLFQKAAGLPITGIADVETQIALFDENAPKSTN